MKSKLEELAGTLEANTPGVEVWLIADAKGDWSIEFRRDKFADPEREAKNWLAEHPEETLRNGYRAQKTINFNFSEITALAVASDLRELAESCDE